MTGISLPLYPSVEDIRAFLREQPWTVEVSAVRNFTALHSLMHYQHVLETLHEKHAQRHDVLEDGGFPDFLEGLKKFRIQAASAVEMSKSGRRLHERLLEQGTGYLDQLADFRALKPDAIHLYTAMLEHYASAVEAAIDAFGDLPLTMGHDPAGQPARQMMDNIVRHILDAMRDPDHPHHTKTGSLLHGHLLILADSLRKNPAIAGTYEGQEMLGSIFRLADSVMAFDAPYAAYDSLSDIDSILWQIRERNNVMPLQEQLVVGFTVPGSWEAPMRHYLEQTGAHPDPAQRMYFGLLHLANGQVRFEIPVNFLLEREWPAPLGDAMRAMLERQLEARMEGLKRPGKVVGFDRMLVEIFGKEPGEEIVRSN